MKKLLLTLTLLLTLGFVASAETWSYSPAKGAQNPFTNVTGNNTATSVTLNNVKWTATFDCSTTTKTTTWTGGDPGTDDNKCYTQFGTSSDYLKSLILSTDAFSDKSIQAVKVRFANASKDARVAMSVKVGDVTGTFADGQDGNATVYSKGNPYDNFSTKTIYFDNASGDITIEFTNSATKGGMLFRSVEVEYTEVVEPETELVGLTHEESFGKTVVRVEYMMHLNNHKDANEYTVELSVGDHVFTNADHSDASIVEETTNAPMRALDPNEIQSETTLKGTIIATGLEGDTPYGEAKLVAKLGDKELGSATISDFTTGTTGIEDVTVEGNEAAEYFNLQGVRVAQPQAGQIYIVRRGAKATKELVK